MDAALNIRQNAQEYQDFVKDLNHWNKNIKNVEKKPNPNVQNPTIPQNPKENVENIEKKNKIKAYDYRAWDKFNVEEACNQVDLENPKSKDSHSLQNQSTPLDSTIVEQALIEKEKGNVYFKKQLFKKALNCYTKSLSLLDDEKVYANRALCWMKLECFQEAERDCTFSLNIDPKNVKALWRRGISKRELGKFKESKLDLQYALILEPSNASIKEELSKVESELSKKTLEKSIPIVLNSNENKLQDSLHSSAEIPSDKIQRMDSKDPLHEEQRPIRRRILIQEYNLSQESLKSTEKSIKNETPIPSTVSNVTKESKEFNATKESKESPLVSLTSIKRELKPPKTMFEFESEFKNYKDNLPKLYEYFKLIPPKSFQELYKNSFEEIHLIKWIQVIQCHFLKYEI